MFDRLLMDVLVKERFEDDHLISRFDETHEGTEHSWINPLIQIHHIMQNDIEPSFAPVVIVTSVSGFSWRPKEAEYASAMAFFSRGRPCIVASQNTNTLSSEDHIYLDTFVGEYWLHSTRSRASFAASNANCGGL